ncbi:membrane intrinsic b-type cytochrome [Sulfurimonas gotlandica GD1]|uniref:Membrane intrinsic b-type cytochrome n=1 Tax=Sulfurimonas gotlandica (strain DSM 19862 / JCM 16533 / GD1) TaxID=929558 RepID=H1FYX3_SULGG|nr:cytochrome b/b6 domain-containing protein [Sulfurimonas gotlandica]EHP29668.1 membrane intrinsic b-type cytochrome [Sulfurimonas gotlandica GD1]
MKYSISFRIWHWLNAIVVLGLLATVFLRKTFLSWRTNSEILMNKLFDMDIEISIEQAKILAKAVRAGMWEWHIILGYALVFLILFRIFLYFKDTSIRESFSSLTLHKKMVHLSYYVIYATLIFMSITGFMIHFYQDLGLLKDTAHDIKEIHELVFNIILYFVPLHIAGVIIADNRDEKGLISTMINGKE